MKKNQKAFWATDRNLARSVRWRFSCISTRPGLTATRFSAHPCFSGIGIERAASRKPAQWLVLGLLSGLDGRTLITANVPCTSPRAGNRGCLRLPDAWRSGRVADPCTAILRATCLLHIRYCRGSTTRAVTHLLRAKSSMESICRRSLVPTFDGVRLTPQLRAVLFDRPASVHFARRRVWCGSLRRGWHDGAGDGRGLRGLSSAPVT